MIVRRHLSRDRWGRFCRPLPTPPLPDPLRHPTESHPRYRLRVFDRCWPWRATKREAVRDAVLSHNARRDRDDRAVYLDACANIQQDPPHRMDSIRARMRRGEL